MNEKYPKVQLPMFSSWSLQRGEELPLIGPYICFNRAIFEQLTGMLLNLIVAGVIHVLWVRTYYKQGW